MLGGRLGLDRALNGLDVGLAVHVRGRLVALRLLISDVLLEALQELVGGSSAIGASSRLDLAARRARYEISI